MGGKGKQTFVFYETRPDVLVSMRERLGLKGMDHQECGWGG
jgi:hypothetical protein